MEIRLRKLKQMSSKLSDGKSIGRKESLTDRMIDLFTTYYRNAILQNKTCLSDMRKAVWAVYFDIRSSDEEPLHSFCPVGPNSWYKYQNQVLEGSVETFRHSNKLPVAVMDAIKPVFNDLSQPKLLQDCLGASGRKRERVTLRDLRHKNASMVARGSGVGPLAASDERQDESLGVGDL
ncbi:uncharacterized protein TNCV_2799021 [Trichonephila clavipes]|nr:uncharacterized protein TNCV_2799021 [Trichonephila clavipes]